MLLAWVALMWRLRLRPARLRVEDGSVGEVLRAVVAQGLPDVVGGLDVGGMAGQPAAGAFEVGDDGMVAGRREGVVLRFRAFALPGEDELAVPVVVGADVAPGHGEHFGGAPAGEQETFEQGVVAGAVQGLDGDVVHHEDDDGFGERAAFALAVDGDAFQVADLERVGAGAALGVEEQAALDAIGAEALLAQDVGVEG